MKTTRHITLDANEAVASVAYRLSEVIALYPITPASAMGESCDEWSAAGKKNLWGQIPHTVEMQSEAGAAGAVHGVLQAGALATTFTASQGLLLMFPNMFKIAGELSPFVLHVAARTLATHGLSIFGDHSDVMAARSTGFAMLCASSVQEAQDFAAISHAATLKSRIPFLHFFDGFRTSHELNRIAAIEDDTLRDLKLDDDIKAFRDHKLTPDAPLLRGTAQNPDTFFQAREAGNRFHDACPAIVQDTMNRFAALTGRQYQLFERFGHLEPEKVIIAMGSGIGAIQETVEWMVKRGEKVGGVVVRLFRPFDLAAFVATLPASVKKIAVLDRTKEPGAVGEPLFQDVVAALFETGRLNAVQVIGGRYGLSSKEFTPAMVRAVFDELGKPAPKKHFTVGINDDVTHLSLAYDDSFDLEPPETVRAVFYGLGSDGTVSSNKQTIKIIGEYAGLEAQGYFIYDSKKSGAITISHLRFGPQPIRSTYRIRQASFVACHYGPVLERHDVLANAAPGATFLLNTSKPADQAFASLPLEVQKQVMEKKLRFSVIDAFQVAQQAGLGRHISAVMQTCFFALSGVLPKEEAIQRIREGVEKSYGKRGSEVVERNYKAIELTLANLHEVKVPSVLGAGIPRPPAVPKEAPDFVQRVTATMMRGEGDLLPVSAFPVDGTWPTGTTKFERRAIALELPTWDEKLCIQCNKCSLICPHAAIRSQLVDPAAMKSAPSTFLTTDFKSKDLGTAPSGGVWKYALQVAPDDCTGCGLCVQVCPARDKANPRHKAIDMNPVEPIREKERANWTFFEQLPYIDRTKVKDDVKATQFLEPLFEFSGACSGCGETPYIKLLTQLVGDRLLIGNATGCSSIFGGNLPTTPYTKNKEGRGPAWANSLFEDNAEFGYGLRLAVDAQQRLASDLLTRLTSKLPAKFGEILVAKQDDEAGIAAQRERVVALKQELAKLEGPEAKQLLQLADSLVKKSVWIVGGDGWAYDIGFGGLDHVLSTGAHVKALVLDTEVYSNTGGQQSKSTPLGASAKFAVAGKAIAKKDLGLLAMSYGNCYVASIAMGAKDAQSLRALKEAEAFPGPALVIAYSHCIAHAYDLKLGTEQQRLAVESGIWPLYRFDPRRLAEGLAPLQLDSPAPKLKARDFMKNEGRFRLVEMKDAKRYEGLLDMADLNAARRRVLYEQLAAVHLETKKEGTP